LPLLIFVIAVAMAVSGLLTIWFVARTRWT